MSRRGCRDCRGERGELIGGGGVEGEGLANHRGIGGVVREIGEGGDAFREIVFGGEEGVGAGHTRRSHAELVQIEVKLRIGGESRGDGCKRRGAGDGAEVVAGGGGAKAEDRVTTASGAGIEGAAECDKRSGSDGGEIRGHAEIAVAKENSFFVE